MPDYRPSSLPPITSVDILDLRSLNLHAPDLLATLNAAPSIHLTGQPALTIASLWRQLPPDEPMRCHIPPFGLRFHNENSLLLAASLCWQCNNIFISANNQRLSYSFDGQHLLSQHLFISCCGALNIPLPSIDFPTNFAAIDAAPLALVYLTVEWSGPERKARGIVQATLPLLPRPIPFYTLLEESPATAAWLRSKGLDRTYTAGNGDLLLLSQGQLLAKILYPSLHTPAQLVATLAPYLPNA